MSRVAAKDSFAATRLMRGETRRPRPSAVAKVLRRYAADRAYRPSAKVLLRSAAPFFPVCRHDLVNHTFSLAASRWKESHRDLITSFERVSAPTRSGPVNDAWALAKTIDDHTSFALILDVKIKEHVGIDEF